MGFGKNCCKASSIACSSLLRPGCDVMVMPAETHPAWDCSSCCTQAGRQAGRQVWVALNLATLTLRLGDPPQRPY